MDWRGAVDDAVNGGQARTPGSPARRPAHARQASAIRACRDRTSPEHRARRCSRRCRRRPAPRRAYAQWRRRPPAASTILRNITPRQGPDGAPPRAVPMKDLADKIMYQGPRPDTAVRAASGAAPQRDTCRLGSVSRLASHNQGSETGRERYLGSVVRWPPWRPHRTSLRPARLAGPPLVRGWTVEPPTGAHTLLSGVKTAHRVRGLPAGGRSGSCRLRPWADSRPPVPSVRDDERAIEGRCVGLDRRRRACRHARRCFGWGGRGGGSPLPRRGEQHASGWFGFRPWP